MKIAEKTILNNDEVNELIGKAKGNVFCRIGKDENNVPVGELVLGIVDQGQLTEIVLAQGMFVLDNCEYALYELKSCRNF